MIKGLITIACNLISVIDRLISQIAVITISICLLICGLLIYENQMILSLGFQNAFKNDSPSRSSSFPDYEEIVAWLTIDETTIDYAIMQTDNNTKYLNTQPDGSFALSGSIFLDYRNQYDFSDDYAIVYGHHMASGAMFGSLDRYYKEKYFKKHRHGTLTLKDGTVYDVMIFAIVAAKATNPQYYDPSCSEILSFLKVIKKESSIYYQPSTNHLLALSTCASRSSLDRTIVFASLSRS